MPKKRKLQPVARPFATTSLPKKAAPEEKKEVKSKPVPDVVTETLVLGSSERVPESEEKVESNELQVIVDRLQEKTEREIGRTLKVIYISRS